MAGAGGSTYIPRWTETVDQLRINGAQVTAHCGACSGSFPVDLERVARAKGAFFSLWNKTERCRTPGCRGRVWFKASLTGTGTPPFAMREAHPMAVRPLDDRWAASRK